MVSQQFQDLDDRRIKKFKECMRISAEAEKVTLPIIAKCVDGMADSANLVDSQKVIA